LTTCIESTVVHAPRDTHGSRLSFFRGGLCPFSWGGFDYASRVPSRMLRETHTGRDCPFSCKASTTCIESTVAHAPRDTHGSRLSFFMQGFDYASRVPSRMLRETHTGRDCPFSGGGFVLFHVRLRLCIESTVAHAPRDTHGSQLSFFMGGGASTMHREYRRACSERHTRVATVLFHVRLRLCIESAVVHACSERHTQVATVL
jgi:hypothetical protein